MTPQDFDDLSKALIGQTIQSMYPGGHTTLGIGLTNGFFFTITALNYDLTINNCSLASVSPSVETLVSEPSDGIL